jgi:uroporphyrinogen decarboxylase
MRQAGRSLPEYRALRQSGTMLDACLTPELAAEITVQPVWRHGVDAAVFFSDIIVPLALVGVEVEIAPGRGPVFAHPLRTAADIARIMAIDPALIHERGEPIVAGVARTTALLAEESERRGEPLPLVGFAGAPFTLAAYLVEGGPSKDHLAARSLIRSDPAAWSALTMWLAEVSGAFLALQLSAGASAGQLFDSWAGSLSPDVYRDAVLPASAAAIRTARTASAPALPTDDDRFPLVHFGVGTGELLADMASIDVDAVGVDDRVPLDEAARRIGRPMPLQGNLDPAVLWAPASVRAAAVTRVLTEGLAAPAHVFNLGHGVPKDTDPDVLGEIVRTVHDWRAP